MWKCHTKQKSSPLQYKLLYSYKNATDAEGINSDIKERPILYVYAVCKYYVFSNAWSQICDFWKYFLCSFGVWKVIMPTTNCRYS